MSCLDRDARELSVWASESLPGNPWPLDMVLTIENSPHALYELLWIREA
jgi:hypothetical protein